MIQQNIKTSSPLRNAFLLLGLFVMLFTPVMYKECLGEDGTMMHLLSSVIYILPICFLLSCIRKHWLFITISLLFMIMSFVETMMVVLYDNYITAGNILSVLGTTPDEGSGFISGSIHKIPWALPAILGGVIAMVSYTKNRNLRINVILMVVTFAVQIAFLSFQLVWRWKGDITTRFYVEQNVISRPPYNFCFQLYNVLDQKRAESLIKEAEGMTFGAKKLPYKGKEVYVMFIGESLRYDNLALSGYHRNTTPNLASLDNLVLYSNYYCTANLTMYSVPQIMTRATPESFDVSYREKSLVQPFKECGFKVYVIGSNIMTTTKHLTAGCDSIITISSKDDDKMGDLVESITQKNEKVLFILHGWGNHGPYDNFKKEQDVFHPNPITDNVGWDNHEANVNAYDNTVLFTDFVIYKVIQAIDGQSTQSALVFVSDHGADYDTGVSDHGGNCNPRKQEYHVPFIFWCSKVWADNHARKLSNVVRHKDVPINSDNVFYSFCDMADISISPQYSKQEWSVFSDKLVVHERKLLVPDGKNCIIVK